MADNIAKANEFKTKGNAAFTAGNYEEAVEHFTKAIELNPNDHVFYSNRSGAFASLEEYEKALEDANKCVSLKPDWAKGYTRKGLAEFYLRNLDDAIATYKKGLELEPTNAQLKEGLERAEEEKSKPPGGGFGGFPGGGKPNDFSMQMLTKLMQNPKTKEYLKDQDFVNKLMMMQQNPQLMQFLIQSDPRMKDAFSVMFGGFDFGGAGKDFPTEEPMSEERAPTTEAHSHSHDGHDHSHHGHSHGHSHGHTHHAEPPKEAPKPAAAPLSEAEIEKNKGNEAYKARNFEEALKHYDRAIELDPNEPLFHNNKAAVYIEMEQHDKALEVVDAVLQDFETRGVRMDVIKLAKLLARKASVFAHRKDYEKAIFWYEKSLLEDSVPKVRDDLKKIQRLKREAEELAYRDPVKAEEHKQLGNEHFKAGRHPDAVKEYSEAVRRNPDDPKIYSNRAQAYMKLMEFPTALRDIEHALKLDPNFAKAWAKKGTIHFHMNEYHKALESYEKGLKLEPDNAECKDGFEKTQMRIMMGGGNEEERLKHAMADPEIQAIMRDPEVVNLLNDLKERPNAKEAREAMKRPDIAAKIQKLIAAGVLKMGQSYQKTNTKRREDRG
eukprot:TRINITY_DN1797_c0_g1_i3.p1 TRINITY_DN1797_c0_g1~~TRINITY_DN1797_c0_g1_i3.p1  ORF type:complete len:608 (+),score=221.37 TRINITY_DN1797_c0_g1_i3:156-1979(+)